MQLERSLFKRCGELCRFALSGHEHTDVFSVIFEDEDDEGTLASKKKEEELTAEEKKKGLPKKRNRKMPCLEVQWYCQLS